MDTQDPESAVPEPSPDGLQVNFCKTPSCRFFGVPAVVQKHKRGRPPVGQTRETTNYVVRGNWAEYPELLCRACGHGFGLKSNLGISEELERLNSFSPPNLTCRNKDCSNYQRRQPTSATVSNASPF